MPLQAWFDDFPLWLLFLMTLALVASAIELGVRMGRRERRHSGLEGSAQVGLAVTSVLGLVAFIVGFVLGLAEARYETRRESKFSEADAISRAFARASFLPDSSRITARRLLRRAATAGLDLEVPRAMNSAIAVLGDTRDSLWTVASVEANAQPESDTRALFVESVSDVFDAFRREIFVARYGRIPPTIWVVFIALTVIGAGIVGYQSGLGSSRRPTSAMAVLAVSLATVVYVIADLDRPNRGTLHMSREAMVELHETFTPRDR